MKLKKAPGHDLIPNVVYKHLTDKALAFLSTIFNRCLSAGYFPKFLKHAEILLFHKPGKPKSNCKSYRPISLLTALSKLLERVISTRLSTVLDENNVIPPYQFGFRQKYSTTQQLLRLTEIINKGFEAKKHTAILFLDIQQAFDKVWIEGLLYKLSQINIPTYLLDTLKSFLQDRTFNVRINGESSISKSINAGIPQGSILGPTLFSIYISDMPSM